MIYLDQHFHSRRAAPAEMDALWAQGWRHFGADFFRYSLAFHHGGLYSVMPLRIRLDSFSPSRSQKRALARNRDLRLVIRETFIDSAKEELFYRHRERFSFNVPESLYDFLSARPALMPCPNQEICAYADERLLAVTFMDLGQTATSGVYAMFDPEEARRSLGILLILESIRYSRERGFRFYYPGYAYREASVYDYKKKFSGLEYFDWQSGWKKYSEGAEQTESAFDLNNFIFDRR
jgi:arginine-tRNA-protein transferase